MGWCTAEWCVLVCLALHRLHTVTSDIQPIEFGTRLKPQVSKSNPTHARSFNGDTPQLQQRDLHAPIHINGKQLPVLNKNSSSANLQRYVIHNSKTELPVVKTKPVINYVNPHPNQVLHKNIAKSESADNDKVLVQSQNLQFNKIEPFWPFSNISSVLFNDGFRTHNEQNNRFPFDSLPDRFKDTTFFFSHIGPNSFEYRAQFHHGPKEFKQPKFFKPFVDEYPEFHKLTFPPFPSFRDTPDLLQNKPHLPDFPNLGHVQFPTIAPPIKRILPPSIEQNGAIKPNIGGPFKPYDIVLGDISTKYPKIFRFNEERINIEDFEREKKLQMKINGINKIHQHDNVPRNQLLILHGGIFTVKEPPLYQRKAFRKRRLRFRNSNRILNS